MKCNVHNMIDNVETIFSVVVMVMLFSLVAYFAGINLF
ncbi:hypothetical protein HOU35_gp001 [Acinetobacter phage vB_AbaM_B09_Aci05]|uniref:Uncharacterized protein n=1 Tax=Acinetobacter phage vB_AbaM_B09_Aci05 TaxID=2315458 RepID=A0A386KBL1_9CAUD|nr:hypothetical protein HOU35_gp001 [Acinetobacter phage vB_AbaM_B09_Aci05]AYD82469.1 hypothetical protein Aci05_001 [Acinetobacter phage vB_AbaM_B09_Aci05]QMP19001.1 hypothetical protein FKOIJHOC_00053 [Acinetobacter phage Ab_121]QQV88701.1 hypothetical protein Liucustia_01 [Acinetobacter phage Liucustia]UYL86183.1 hypothetical protein [Acinetobacter phage vB_AbaM_CP14]